MLAGISFQNDAVETFAGLIRVAGTGELADRFDRDAPPT